MIVSTERPQAQPSLVLTPERISDITGLPIDRVKADLSTVGSREELIQELLKNRNGDSQYSDSEKQLNTHLENVHETLEQKKTFFGKLKDGVMWTLKKAWQVVTYPIRHPFRTAAYAALVLALAGAGFYLAGEGELFMTTTGLDKVAAYFSATSELAPPVAPTDIVPGAGESGVPGIGDYDLG